MAAPSIKTGTGVTEYLHTFDAGVTTPDRPLMTGQLGPLQDSTIQHQVNTANGGWDAGYLSPNGAITLHCGQGVYSGALQGIGVALPSPKDVSNALIMFSFRNNTGGLTTLPISQTTGVQFGMSSGGVGTQEAFWVFWGTNSRISTLWETRLIDPNKADTANVYDNGTGGRGTFDPTNVTHVWFAYNSGAVNQQFQVSNVSLFIPPVLINGDTNDRGTLQDFVSYIDSKFQPGYNQPMEAVLHLYFPGTIGDGSTPAWFDDTTFQYVEFISTVDFAQNYAYAHVENNVLGLKFDCHPSHVDGGIYRLQNKIFSGPDPYKVHISGDPEYWEPMICIFYGADEILLPDGFEDRSTWDGCGPLLCSQPTLNGTVIKNGNTVGLRLDATNGLTNCTNLTIQNKAVGIQVTVDGPCSLDITGHNVAGNNTLDIEHAGNGILTITATSAQAAVLTTLATGLGSIVVSAPTSTLTVTSSEANSLIQVFDGDGQTPLDSITGNSLAYDHSAETVRFTVQKAGFIPYRSALIALSGSPTFNIELVPDPAYNLSHGLTRVTHYNYDPATRVTRIVNPQQGRDIYSALINAFISDSDLWNRPFPITAVGIDRFDFTSDGTTPATIHADDILNWLGAGMTWEHAITGNPTHKFCFVKGTGANAAGTKGYYQHTDGAAPDALTLVNNNINQVVQYYSDPNGDGSLTGGYNRPSHAVVKLFNDGYYQASANILTAYDIAELEPQEYIVPMQMVSTGLGTGDRGITITVTDNTPAGVEEQTGYTFDYKIEGGASDSPEDILRQWIYDIYTDPTASTYASKINFNWPDPILETGGNYETKRGIVYGEDTPTTLHGFYVEEGTDYHPDFTRQQANNGTYYLPPTLAGVSMPNLTAGWVELYNATTDSLIESVANTSGYSHTWVNGTDATAGDEVRLRWRGYKKLPIEVTFTVTADNTQTANNSPVADTSAETFETTLGVTGADIDALGEFVLDGVNVQLDINDPDNIWYLSRMYLWYSYKMVGATGISLFWDLAESPNPSSVIINRSKAPVLIDNAKVDTCRQGDAVVLTTDDGTFPVANPTSGGGGVSLYFEGIGYTVVTGDGPLTGPQQTQLSSAAQALKASTIIENGETLQEILRLLRTNALGNIVDNGDGSSSFKGADGATTRFKSTPVYDEEGIAIGRIVTEINGA